MMEIRTRALDAATDGCQVGFNKAFMRVLVDRLSGRLTCPKDGSVYHLRTNPPKRPGVCDRDATPLVQRPDDQPDAVRRRLAEYENKTALLTDYYKPRGILRNIEGVGTPEEVEGRIAAALRDHVTTGPANP